MLNAEENRLLGQWQELAVGSAMQMKVQGVSISIAKHQWVWSVLILLESCEFSFSLLENTRKEFQAYHLLLLRERCYLHRVYHELTPEIITHMYQLADKIAGK